MFTQVDGRKLAIQMLYELQTDEIVPLTLLPAKDRPIGKLQQDVFGQYLRVLMDRGDEALTAGFSSVLTDFLGAAVNGSVPYPWIYEDISESDLGPGTM